MTWTSRDKENKGLPNTLPTLSSSSYNEPAELLLHYPTPHHQRGHRENCQLNIQDYAPGTWFLCDLMGKEWDPPQPQTTVAQAPTDYGHKEHLVQWQTPYHASQVCLPGTFSQP